VFTIMTWNIENFFAPEPADRADFDVKLDALAGVITARGAGSAGRAGGR
jgi:hypothetical protein